RFGTQW
ncbi:hypothetical protein D030_2819B, partial [Vibrio parahaemolyticus AQ3810]